MSPDSFSLTSAPIMTPKLKRGIEITPFGRGGPAGTTAENPQIIQFDNWISDFNHGCNRGGW